VRPCSQPQLVSARTTPKRLRNRLDVRCCEVSLSARLAARLPIRPPTPGIDVVLGGGWRTLGTQTRRESLTCDGLGMQLFVSNSLNTSVVLLQYLPVLLYLIKLSQSRRRPSPTHFWPACRDCVCLSCTPRSMELIVCLCTAVLHGLGCCCPFSHVAGMEAWEIELSE
jgi:hypothetical protein